MLVTLTASTPAGDIETTVRVETASSNGLISMTLASYMTQRSHTISTQVDVHWNLPGPGICKPYQ